MRQHKFDHRAREDAMQDIADVIESNAEDTEKALDVVYNLQDYLGVIGIREDYESVVMSYIIENMQEASKTSLEDWRAGDIYVAGDVGDIDGKIKRELTNIIEKRGE